MRLIRDFATKLRRAAGALSGLVARGGTRRVLDVSGKPVGTLQNVLRDTCGRILLMEVTARRHLGLRSTRLLVPGEVVGDVTEHAIQVTVTRDRLNRGPALRPAKPGPCLDEVYSYYGCSRPVTLRVYPGSSYSR